MKLLEIEGFLDDEQFAKAEKKLNKLLSKVKQIIFLTSGQLMVWDKDENQIDELQAEFTDLSKPVNRILMKRIADKSKHFSIMKWGHGGWIHELTKDEFYRLTGIE